MPDDSNLLHNLAKVTGVAKTMSTFCRVLTMTSKSSWLYTVRLVWNCLGCVVWDWWMFG